MSAQSNTHILQVALGKALTPELTDSEMEAALRGEQIYTWGPQGEAFERMFASVMKLRGKEQIAKAKGDATLAAAAPELLEALEGLVDDEPCWFDHHGNCQAHGINNPCEMAIARHAIAKAKGGVL